jgi:general secretion pathway protein I
VRRHGFTLLEVMIAVLILAVGLSSLFTSEAGAVRIAQRARTTTIATLLARCKMAEIEERIAKEGWPAELIDDRDECCEDGEHDGYTCEWKVERIKLPDVEKEEGEEEEGEEGDKGGDGEKEPATPGVIDKLAELSKGDPEERMGAITGLLSGDPDKSLGSSEKGEKGSQSEDDDDASESELDPIASMVMEMAFPVMKPVIEEGVRRASVKVLWKEGSREQELEVVQFLVTEEQLILPDGDEEDGGVPGSTNPGSSPGSQMSNQAPGTTNTPSRARSLGAQP